MGCSFSKPALQLPIIDLGQFERDIGFGHIEYPLAGRSASFLDHRAQNLVARDQIDHGGM